MARASGTSVINFPGAGGGTSYLLIIGAIIAIVGLIYFIKKNPNFPPLLALLPSVAGGNSAYSLNLLVRVVFRKSQFRILF